MIWLRSFCSFYAWHFRRAFLFKPGRTDYEVLQSVISVLWLSLLHKLVVVVLLAVFIAIYLTFKACL